MAESNRVRVSYLPESTWGTTPTTGTLQVTRRTGGAFNKTTDTTESQEVRSDRGVAALVRTMARAEGDYDFEWSLTTLNDLFGHVAANASTTLTITASTVISATATTDLFTDTAAGGAFTNAVVGQWIRVSGFSNAANNGFHKITAKPSNDVVEVLGSTLVTEAATPAITITGTHLIFPGTTPKSVTIEQAHLDTGDFLIVPGARARTMELNMAVGEIITGNIGFLGKTLTTAGSTLATGSVTLGAATSTSPLNAVDNITSILEGGADPGVDIQSISLSYDNTLREQSGLGRGPVLTKINYGTARLTGSINMYFEDTTVLDKYLAFTQSSLSLLVFDGAVSTTGNACMINIPQIQFSTGNVDAGGLDTDVMISLDFTAEHNAATGTTMSFDFFV